MSSIANQIKICCYQVQGVNHDKQQQQIRTEKQKQNTLPMLSMQMNSKIKFSNLSKRNTSPVYQLLLRLYDIVEKSEAKQIFQLLSKKRINPDLNEIGERDDIQYYIPQLITYLVIEQGFQDEKLIEIILQACITDFYFAHNVYFYLNSLTYNWNNEPIEKVMNFIKDEFMGEMNIYKKNRLSGIQFTKGMLAHEKHLDKFLETKASEMEYNPQIIYGTKDYPNPPPELPPIIVNFKKKKYSQNGFMQTPNFWNDLITIGEDISSEPVEQRNDLLQHLIKTRINKKLPAHVYVPFFKDNIRMYTVLCVWKGRLFSTKQRAPYSIWVELYREQQELELIEEVIQNELDEMKYPKKQKKQKVLDKIYQTLSRPFSISDGRNTLNLKKFFQQKFDKPKKQLTLQRKKSKLKNTLKNKSTFHEYNSAIQSRNIPKDRLSLSFIYDPSEDEQQIQSIPSSISSNQKRERERLLDEHLFEKQNQKEPIVFEDYFPPKSSLHIEQIKRRSIYRNLKSWRVAHLMVKTGDDLKQQQFAMQLINNFANIFKKEKIDCVVFPYEVISLGPNYGILEMLQDVTTFDSLFKNLSQRNLTLKQFFNKYFPDKVKAKKNFLRSLAGYCLITYFLQVKDRHNGNILLNRDGFLIHIDFGFFLSNMPGKGVELQKNVPFKLLTEYVQVIGSLSSQSFFEFRRLFYKGFVAITRHRQCIISLVKMMYSSHGQSMGCFIKSQQAVYQLERRLNPPENIEQFCYDLINNSLDNWRSKWYDKFQYFLQKIYY